MNKSLKGSRTLQTDKHGHMVLVSMSPSLEENEGLFIGKLIHTPVEEYILPISLDRFGNRWLRSGSTKQNPYIKRFNLIILN